MDYTLALMTGIDIPYEEASLIVHQPTILELSYMGEEDLFSAIHYLVLEKNQITQDENVLSHLSNFQVLMKVISQPEAKERKMAIITLLSMMFPSYKVMTTPNSFIFSQDGQSYLIDNNNFLSFQTLVKDIFCTSHIFQGGNVVYNPANAKAKEIADKIMRGRQKVASMKGKEKDSVISRYLSILAVGLQLPLDKCLSLTLYQLFDLVERYNLYSAWDIDTRVRLAGGKPDREVDNWMKNIHTH